MRGCIPYGFGHRGFEALRRTHLMIVNNQGRCTGHLSGGKFNKTSALPEVAAKPGRRDIAPTSPTSLLFDVHGGTWHRRTARQESQGRRRERLVAEEDERRHTDYVQRIDDRRQRVDT
jgi:hypothetical protein